MSVSLLAPVVLGLGLLVGGPILAHIARRRPVRQVPFGAMMLLKRLEKRLRRRRRVQDPWLLVLRVLAVLLAVLAASRPEVRWPGTPPPDQASGPVVVVVDTSLSMDQREGDSSLLAQAREQAVEALRLLPPGTRTGLVSAGGAARAVTPELVADPGLVAAEAATLQQTQAGTDLAGALGVARRLLDGKGGTVLVFTDEAGKTAVPATADELSLMGDQNVALEPRVVRPSTVQNAVVSGAIYGEGVEGGSVRLTVDNLGETPMEVPVVVTLPDGAEITAFVEVGAGESAEKTVTVPRVAAGGVALARVEDPALPADNTHAFQLPRVGASRVLVVDGDPGLTPSASEVYFLERALAPWGASGAMRGGVLPDVTSTAGVVDLDPEVHRVVFLANVSDPSALAPRLMDFVRRGGGLVVALGDNVTPELYNGPLASLLPSPLKRPQALAAPGEDGLRTELPDTDQTLFSPFARGGRGAFGKTRWRQLYALEPFEEGDGVTTLLRTESGMPVLVERTVGRGRVLLLTGTLDLGWGSFPLQSAYMPFVQRIVTYLGGEAGGGGERLSGRVEDPVEVLLPSGVVEATVSGPAGPVAARIRGSTLSFVPDRSGAYLVETPGAPPLAWVAVNTDLSESDVRPGPSLQALAATVDPDRYERRLALGPFLLWAVLLLAALQAGVAVVLGRRARAAAQDESPAPQGDSPEPLHEEASRAS